MSDKELHQDLNELKALNMQGLLLHLSTKEDLYQAKSELRTDIANLKADLTDKIEKGDSSLADKIEKGDSSLKAEIKEVKGSLKWANRLIITGLIGLLIGLLKLFIPTFLGS